MISLTFIGEIPLYRANVLVALTCNCAGSQAPGLLLCALYHS